MTIYAHIEDGVITGRYDTLPSNWRNISNFFTLVDETEYLHSLGWRTIVKDTTPFDETTHRLGEATYVIIEDEVVETVPQYEVSPAIVDNVALHNSAMVYLRQKRDVLLKETDFSQLTDVISLNGTEVNQAYIVYRQALRDLPDVYENDSTFINIDNANFPVLQLPSDAPADPAPEETPPV